MPWCIVVIFKRKLQTASGSQSLGCSCSCSVDCQLLMHRKFPCVCTKNEEKPVFNETMHSGKYWQFLAHNKIPILFKISENQETLIGPSDVGGTCPAGTYNYRKRGSNSCCCGHNCCFGRCLSRELSKYTDCLSGVPNSAWEWNNDLRYYQATRPRYSGE